MLNEGGSYYEMTLGLLFLNSTRNASYWRTLSRGIAFLVSSSLRLRLLVYFGWFLKKGK